MGKLIWAGAALAMVALIALDPGRDAPEADAAGITLQEIAPGTSSPVSIVNAGDGSGRLFVVEQAGRVRVINNAGMLLGPAFIDISAQVNCCGEEGLLNIAFHPSYETNGRFFLYYTNDSGDIEIRGYTAPVPGSNVANAGAGQTVIVIPHPVETNHNGGALAFGPDGYLYAGIGDGGGGGDPNNYAQNKNSLLGKIIRLDISSAPYAIPATNPYAGATPGADEIWAIGLRNPWRISFDRLNGDLYIGDVGQDAREEANRQLAGAAGGANYGWRLKEGTICYNPASGCDPGGLTDPILEYAHGGPSGICAITGGYRYRGAAASLAGQYLYADFCSGEIWGATLSGPTWTSSLLLDSSVFVASFGEDEAGELYITDSLQSKVYRIVADPDSDGDGVGDTSDNCVSVPNAGQENDDRNFINLAPEKAYNDLTLANSDNLGNACDADDDNDGRSDAAEAAGTGCGSFTTSNALLRDTDGDRFLDGAECAMATPTNPNDAASQPTLMACGATTDVDGDGLSLRNEVCFYNTNPSNANTDGDLCPDGKEVASINANTTVDAIDLGQVAQAFGAYLIGAPAFRYNFDYTKSGTIDSIDLGQVAQRFGAC